MYSTLAHVPRGDNVLELLGEYHYPQSFFHFRAIIKIYFQADMVLVAIMPLYSAYR